MHMQETFTRVVDSVGERGSQRETQQLGGFPLIGLPPDKLIVWAITGALNGTIRELL